MYLYNISLQWCRLFREELLVINSHLVEMCVSAVGPIVIGTIDLSRVRPAYTSASHRQTTDLKPGEFWEIARQVRVDYFTRIKNKANNNLP